MKKYYDTDLIGSGGGYTMTEIEKKAEHLYPYDSPAHYGPVAYEKHKWEVDARRQDYLAGAAAVIELIRERMPGKRTKPMPGTIVTGASAEGFNAYRSEILKILETIK